MRSARLAHPAFTAVVALAVVSAVGAPALGPAHALAAPKAEIAQRTVDFGTIAPYEESVREVAIRNAGDETLVVGEARALSEQARAAAARDTLPAGAESVLRLALVPIAPGGFETKVIVSTNDPVEPTIILVLRADVAPRVVLDTEPRFLGLLRPGEASSAEIAIRFRAGLASRLERAGSTLPFVRFAPRAGADSLEAVVRATLAAEAPRGIHHGAAALIVSYPHLDTLYVPIGVEVTGRWRVVPFPFTLGKTTSTRRDLATILCERTVKKAAHVTGASTDIPDYKVVVDTVTEGRTYRVRLLPAAGWKSGEWDGTVRIETDDPEEREIIVPATVFVGKL